MHLLVQLEQLGVAVDEGGGGGAGQELGVAQHVLQEQDVGLQGSAYSVLCMFRSKTDLTNSTTFSRNRMLVCRGLRIRFCERSEAKPI